MKTASFQQRVTGLFAVLLFAASGLAHSEAPSGTPAVPVDASYRLQPGDVLEISVWKEEDLRRQALIRTDGGLSFPLAGDLIVAGLTVVDVRRELEQRLAKFIPDVTVSVAVQQINGNQVFVVGRVNRPGAYKLDRPLDVMQVLSLAGGTTEFAGLDNIRILRRGSDGHQESLMFAYSDVARGRRLAQNIVLQSGDTVVVP
jgi:polysaccharide export outer membrane protein